MDTVVRRLIGVARLAPPGGRTFFRQRQTRAGAGDELAAVDAAQLEQQLRPRVEPCAE